MKNVKKILSIFLVMGLVISMFAGCSSKKEVKDTQQVTNEKEEENKDGQDKPQQKPVELLAYGSFFGQPLLEKIMTMYKEENPHVTFKIINTEDDGSGDALKILLGAGDSIDLVSLDNPIMMRTFAKNSLVDLTDLAKQNDFDFDEAYGVSGAEQCTYEDKKVMVSITKTTWFMMYNKQIFDNANVPYPSEDKSMTWSEYREIAKKLTTGEGADKTYGALSLQWPMFYYGQAIQSLGGGDKFYTADGMSNIEAPAFADAFEFWKGMTDDDKSMPDLLTVISRQFPYTEFLSGNYGMHIYGSWVFGLLKDQEQFPRDWNVGIAPMPVPEGSDNTISWGVYAGCGIPTTAKNQEEAFKFLKYATEKAPLVSESEITSYSKGDNSVLAKKLVSGLEEEGMTAELLEKVLFNPETEMVTEKITGTASVEYQNILEEEFQKYVSGDQSIDSMIQAVKKRADKAIKESN